MTGLVIERRGGIAILTIDRPHAANALDAATSHALDTAMTEAEVDDGIGAVIVTAAGNRAFCAGMDMKEAARTGAGQGLVADRGFGGITARRRTKPLIAAVNGAAIAGGMEIALACDFIFAADHATFGLSEVKRGLFAFAGGVQRLARELPRATALPMILTGEPLGAARLHALGLVTEVTGTDRLMPRTLEVTESMLRHSPAALRHAMALFDASRDMGHDLALHFGAHFGRATLQSADSAEGVAAFAQGRPANFNS